MSSHFRLNAFVIQTKLNLGMNEDRLGGPPKWPLKGNLQRGVADFFLAIEQQVREKQQWGRQQRAHAERVAGNREYRQSGMQGTGSTCRACCREQGAQAELDAAAAAAAAAKKTPVAEFRHHQQGG